MEYFQLLQEKTSFVSSRKQPHVPSDYNLYSSIDFQVSNHVFK